MVSLSRIVSPSSSAHHEPSGNWRSSSHLRVRAIARRTGIDEHFEVLRIGRDEMRDFRPADPSARRKDSESNS